MVEELDEGKTMWFTWTDSFVLDVVITSDGALEEVRLTLTGNETMNESSGADPSLVVNSTSNMDTSNGNDAGANVGGGGCASTLHDGR